MDNERKYGKIKLYKAEVGVGGGYGFIVPDVPGDDIFFHITKIDPGSDLKPEDLVKDLKVGYEIVKKKKGYQAINIDKIFSGN